MQVLEFEACTSYRESEELMDEMEIAAMRGDGA